eukprot:1287473-Rhodomonas_salina.1
MEALVSCSVCTYARRAITGADITYAAARTWTALLSGPWLSTAFQPAGAFASRISDALCPFRRRQNLSYMQCILQACPNLCGSSTSLYAEQARIGKRGCGSTVELG